MPTSTMMRKRRNRRKRTQRKTSNVFAMLGPDLLQKLKEAFSYLDQDRDSVIGREDLRSTYNSVGEQ